MDATVALRISTSDPTPPYEQLRVQLLELISAGQLRADQRLPPVRQLASDLGLAAGTVARTYRELESEGFVVTRRGGGTRVGPTVPRRTPERIEQALHAKAGTLVRQARLLGASDEQITAAVQAALSATSHDRHRDHDR